MRPGESLHSTTWPSRAATGLPAKPAAKSAKARGGTRVTRAEAQTRADAQTRGETQARGAETLTTHAPKADP